MLTYHQLCVLNVQCIIVDAASVAFWKMYVLVYLELDQYRPLCIRSSLLQYYQFICLVKASQLCGSALLNCQSAPLRCYFSCGQVLKIAQFFGIHLNGITRTPLGGISSVHKPQGEHEGICHQTR